MDNRRRNSNRNFPDSRERSDKNNRRDFKQRVQKVKKRRARKERSSRKQLVDRTKVRTDLFDHFDDQTNFVHLLLPSNKR